MKLRRQDFHKPCRLFACRASHCLWQKGTLFSRQVAQMKNYLLRYPVIFFCFRVKGHPICLTCSLSSATWKTRQRACQPFAVFIHYFLSVFTFGIASSVERISLTSICGGTLKRSILFIAFNSSSFLSDNSFKCFASLIMSQSASRCEE